jgi:DNA polymerase-3 subunit epsilon
LGVLLFWSAYKASISPSEAGLARRIKSITTVLDFDCQGIIAELQQKRNWRLPNMATDPHAKFLAIDFETANQYRNSACSIGLVRVENNQIVHKSVHLIRPPYKSFTFTYIHGLSWEDVKTAPPFDEVWTEIKPYFEGVDFLAAHNASFDSSVLKACCARYDIQAPSLPFACTMKLARKTWNLYPTKLSDVCRYLEIQLNHHEALSDANACAQIIIASNLYSRQKSEESFQEAAASSK